MTINAKTELYCIFGNPVEHSFSPIMHNRAFQKLGINAVYVAFKPKSIEEAIVSMKTLNIKGGSITIPYKIDAMKFVDVIDPLAKKIGSINTLKNINNVIHGFNTDGYGAVEALKKQNLNISNSNILIIGNGGSARAISFALLESNANIIIAGRNTNKIQSLSNDLSKIKKTDYILLNQLNNKTMENIDIIINTTPIGMTPKIDEIPIDENLINKKHSVFDIIYSPNTTKLLSVSKEKGCTIIHGSQMLLYQGINQFEIWTEQKAPYDIMHDTIKEKLQG